MNTKNGQCKNRKLCGAKTRSGSKCRNQPVHGNRRCRMHGGQSLAGAAAPAFKHGRYSKYLPERLRAQFEEAVSDPELTSLRAELALVELRITVLLRRLNSDESGRPWARLYRTYTELVDARAKGNVPETTKLTLKLGQMLKEGNSQEQLWRELLDTIQRKADVASREWRRMAHLEQFISAERAIVLITAVVDVVKQHVTDRQTLSLISREIGALYGPGQEGENGDGSH